MYKPNTNTAFEVRGQYIGTEVSYECCGYIEKEYIFGYSRMRDYDEKDGTMFAEDLGYWVHCENIYEVSEHIPKEKFGCINLILTDEQLKQLVDGTYRWQDCEKLKKDMEKQLMSDKWFYGIVGKYTKIDSKRKRRSIMKKSIPFHEYTTNPSNLLYDIAMTQEDLGLIERHYQDNYSSHILLDKHEYYHKILDVFRKLTEEKDEWKAFWNDIYTKWKEWYK